MVFGDKVCKFQALIHSSISLLGKKCLELRLIRQDK